MVDDLEDPPYCYDYDFKANNINLADDNNTSDIGEEEAVVIDLPTKEIDDYMEDILFSKKDTPIAISYYFMRVLEVPANTKWTGTDGAIHKALHTFNLKYASKDRNNYKWVRNIFEDLLEAISKCKKFCVIKRYKEGRGPILKIKLEEAIILTNTIEEDLGLKFARNKINKCRVSFGLAKVRFDTFFGLHKSLKPVPKKTMERKTGKRDKESPFAMACFNWCRQLLVSYGVIWGREDYAD